MLRIVRLHERFSACDPAAASANLRDQVEAALRRPEIRQIESEIGRDDAGQGHGRVVETLGDHLGSDQNVATRFELVENARVIADARRGVGVHPQNARAGKEPPYLFHNSLGADSQLFDALVTARRAADWNRALKVAIVTAQQPFAAME